MTERRENFYIIRNADTFQGDYNPPSGTRVYNKQPPEWARPFDSLAEAKAAALINSRNAPLYVYEVKLIGVAAPASAQWESRD